MPELKFDVVSFDGGYVIDVKWPNGSVERAPGLFTSEEAAKECVSSEGFVGWWRARLHSQKVD